MRRSIYFLLLVVIFSMVADDLPLTGKSVVFVIAPEFFRDEELIVPSSRLADLGADIQIASTTLEEVEGMMGMIAKPELLIKDIKQADFDAIVVVGGVGAEKLWDNNDLHKVLKDFDKADKLIGAICLAPVVVARAGLLDDQKATSFPSAKDEMTKAKVQFEEKSVVISGNIVTADGPESVEQFTKTLSNFFIPATTKAHD